MEPLGFRVADDPDYVIPGGDASYFDANLL